MPMAPGSRPASVAAAAMMDWASVSSGPGEICGNQPSAVRPTRRRPPGTGRRARRDRPLHRQRGEACPLELVERPSKVTDSSVHSPRSRPICSSSGGRGSEVLAQGLVLDPVPADAEAEPEPARGQQVDLGGLLGQQGGLALGRDDDAGDQLQRGQRGEVAEHHERLVERGGRSYGPPARVHRRVGADHVVVGQHVGEAELLDALAVGPDGATSRRARSGGTPHRSAWLLRYRNGRYRSWLRLIVSAMAW